MKIQALYDLQQEINRLFIAGSKFAKNDPRLNKHIPVLNKLGEKAPVFKKLAQDIENLTEAESIGSSEKLLEISVLLYSILYTQGETNDDNPLKELAPIFNMEEISTSVSYLELQPVIEALSISRQGRYAIVEDAFKSGIFNDFRTFRYLNQALADKYSELADYVEKIIIPSISTKILPFIKKDFSYEGKPDDIRRFRILSKLENQAAIDEIALKILESSSPNLQAEAVTVLGKNPQHEKLIIALADDKQKPVREAAYLALATYSTEESLEKLKNVFIKNKSKSNLPGIVTALSNSKMPFFFQEIFNQVQKSFQDLIALDKSADEKVLSAAFEKFNTEFEILQNKDQKDVYDFIKDVFSNKAYNELINAKKNRLSYGAQELTDKIAANLYQANNTSATEVLEFLAKSPYSVKEWNKGIISFYFMAASRNSTKEQMFNIFADHFKKGNISSHLLFVTYGNIPSKTNRSPSEWIYSTFQFSYIEQVDAIEKRWVPLLVDDVKKGWNNPHALESLHLVMLFEGIESKQVRKLLEYMASELTSSKNRSHLNDLGYIADKLADSGSSKCFELIFSVIESYPKNNQYANYYVTQLADEDFIKRFPKEYIKKFRSLAEKTKLDGFTKIAEVIETSTTK